MSAFLTAANRLRIAKIENVRQETPKVKSFAFKDKLCSEAKPGQFVMVWVPDVDEIPMSLSGMSPHACSISVQNVGEATKALHQRKAGDLMGIRGPFGNCFCLVEGNVMIVGGGTGIASLMPLVESLVKENAKVTFLLGAKTRNELLFRDRIQAALSKKKGRFEVTTEDGSYGSKGVVTDFAEKHLAKEKFDMIYTCGPERMMYKMLLLSERFQTPLQASLERLMRCAIGICGTCVIGKFRVCKDGPVFTGEQLSEEKEEFGHFKRAFDGRKVKL
ncbi:MAG: dihydroorotate dehydrogenase electron transfer subunit [Candidatus Bathyarchaeia archaeon]